MTSNVLSVRDSNVQLKSTPPSSPEKGMVKSLEYHRQVLKSRMDNGQPQPYVSPSDDITSPASQKLQAFKNKHMTKKSKPQTLFKKTSSKKLELAKGPAMFADIPKDDGAKEESFGA